MRQHRVGQGEGQAPPAAISPTSAAIEPLRLSAHRPHNTHSPWKIRFGHTPGEPAGGFELRRARRFLSPEPPGPGRLAGGGASERASKPSASTTFTSR